VAKQTVSFDVGVKTATVITMKQIFFIDLFAGAGGVSEGIERASVLGKKAAKVIAAVNHDPLAISSHRVNHKNVWHFTEDIRTLELSPLAAMVRSYRKRYPNCVIILWSSLECTNISNAKGGLSRDADSRTLCEHMYRYIEVLQPDCLWVENVREFRSNCPVRIKSIVSTETYCSLEYDNKTNRPIYIPDKSKTGSTFVEWVEKIKSYGYGYDDRDLNAADYSAHTSRIRYFGQFNKSHVPTVWPSPTHSKRGRNGLKPWRPVREVLDFSLPAKSIFGRRKPLVKKTMQRIYSGLLKYVAGGEENYRKAKESLIKNNDANSPLYAEYFIERQFTTSGWHQSLEEPAGTILTNPKMSLVKICGPQHFLINPQYGNGGSSIDAPCFTLIARMDKASPTFVTAIPGGPRLGADPSDCEYTQKVKEFMRVYGIEDITMRHLNLPELLKIQGFPERYYLAGPQSSQKKFIGNSVPPVVPQHMIKTFFLEINKSEFNKKKKANETYLEAA
jgi:DNA (cytosine-5)-methyltransferase 1